MVSVARLSAFPAAGFPASDDLLITTHDL
ncbi:hypothetical protein GMOD_00005965 [Pyrenophora seminiperda CCB06]|uniref:Uncharacterized protein n=1 Tax=Pyrenophora seminiperda CCB06 TaxID=1302712 RepID=A0A3M7MAJ6_9PLEO|nr:hypothetical protein GMOD_00005965 [Pyrenophora seminiperda CCB06]